MVKETRTEADYVFSKAFIVRPVGSYESLGEFRVKELEAGAPVLLPTLTPRQQLAVGEAAKVFFGDPGEPHPHQVETECGLMVIYCSSYA